MSVGGKGLVATILQNIDRADVFACDLTYPNRNVSFELGYAIGRFKRIWIALNTSIEGAEQGYRRLFYGLLGSGYVQYNNSVDLTTAFLESRPFRDLEQSLLGDTYRRPVVRQEDPVLLYVKPPTNTEAVNATTETLRNSSFGDSMITDDPFEVPSLTLDWYAGKLRIADGVLCHLLGNHQTGHSDHNVKCSLVAGLSRGFQKNMLMLAEKPFDSPIDYQALLNLHDTANEMQVRSGEMDRRSQQKNSAPSPSPSTAGRPNDEPTAPRSKKSRDW